MKTGEELQEKTIVKKGEAIMTNSKSESGITLIALVITIILLLILATISIAMVTGDNGIIKTARQAQIETTQGAEKEQIGLAYNAVVTTQYATASYDASKGFNAAKLQEELNNQKAEATATDDTTVGVIRISFNKSKNVYKLDTKRGTIEGPITLEDADTNTTENP